MLEDFPLNLLALCTLAEAIQALVQRQIDAGDLKAAAASCETLLAFSSHLAHSPSCLIETMTAVAISGRSANAAETLVCNTDIPLQTLEDAGLPQALTFSLTNGYARGVSGEFCMLAAYIDETNDRTKVGSVPGKVQRIPVISSYVYHRNRTRQTLASYYRSAITSIARPATQIQVKEPERSSNPIIRRIWMILPNSIGRYLELVAIPNLRGSVTETFKKESRLRCLHTILALRAYQRDKGTPPESLADLIPRYLPTLPIDPFDGTPLRYQPEHQRIYSIGENLHDDNGNTTNDIPFTIRSYRTRSL